MVRPEMPAAAIVVAAGAGQRMGAALPKALLPLGGRPLVAWCLEALAASTDIGRIVLVVPRGHERESEMAIGAAAELHAIVPGGATRARSVQAGLAALPASEERVLVHDAARPLLTPALVEAVLAALSGVDGVIAAAPLTDTLKRADGDLNVVDTVDRAGLWRAQTPQAFDAPTLRAAVAEADAAGTLDDATDCAGLMEAAGGLVRVVPWSSPNLKVTTPADLELAERLIAARQTAC